MRRFSVVHVVVAAGLAAATVTGVVVIQQVSASGGTSSVFVPIQPCRLADTRRAPDNVGVRNTPVGQGEAVTFQVSGVNGKCSIPGTATAIGGNLTAVGPTAGGFLTAYPTGGTRPLTSNLNFSAGNAPIANAFTVALSAGGALNLFNNAGRVDAIIDINGYYEPSTSGPAGPKGATGNTGPVSASCIALLRWDTCNRAFGFIVGGSPQGVAFDGTSIWVTNTAVATVSKIDPSTNTVTATVTVGSNPTGVAFDGTSIWVTNNGSNSVSKINPSTNTVTATVTVGSNPTGVAFDGTSIWVANNISASVSKINPSTNTVTATVIVGLLPREVAFDGTSIWVTEATSVSKIDPSTNTQTATVSVAPEHPVGLAFDGTNIWYTSESQLGSLSRIDVKQNTDLGSVALFGVHPRGVAFDGTSIWVAVTGSASVWKINPSTLTVTAKVTVGSQPLGLAFDGTNIWVANSGAAGVSKIRV